MIDLLQMAQLLGADLRTSAGDRAGGSIASVASIAQASQNSLVFAEDEATFATALASPAAAILVSPEVARKANPGEGTRSKVQLLCAEPRLAFARAAKLLRQARAHGPAHGIHPSASIAPGVLLGQDVSIGAYAVVEDSVSIGRGSKIGSGVVIGTGSSIGTFCVLYPRVVLYPGTALGDRVIVHAGAVLGGDGFGYVLDPANGEYLQFPQQGRLVIEDDVEVGANTTIDRGALEETRIGRGAKIDNLVHIGHNVSIGRNTVIAAQTGISGSTTIGNGVILGGQVGIGDHAQVGDGVILGGQAGILPHKNFEGAGMLFWGTPAQPVKRYLRQLAALSRLVRASTAAKTGGSAARGEESTKHSPEG